MTRDLLKRAEADLRVAGMLIKSTDEYDMQLCAYHVQQAAEKLLKQLYIEQGVDFRKTHDMASLLSGIPNWEEYMTEEDYLRFGEKAALLTEWESKTRYAEGYLIARQFVVSNLDFVTSLFKDILVILGTHDKQNSVGGKNASSDIGGVTKLKFD